METKEISRGRLIDHLHFVVRDIDVSRGFYSAALGALGFSIQMSGPDFFVIDELFISSKESRAAQGVLTGRTHLAFQATSRESVEKFYAAALEAGGKDYGKPGERSHYHPGYFAAFVLDPDGNNIEAVFHGPARRSADAVTINWS